MNQEGSIQLIIGPMFSGKSSELLRKVRRFEHSQKKCLVIDYLHDNRYSLNQEMVTHDKISRKTRKSESLMTLIEDARNYQVVAIDEGQFFKDIVLFCETLASENVIVIVAALDSTFERKPFGQITQLIPLAENVQKLSAVCTQCSRDAYFTKRLNNSKEVELFGGEQLYKPVCRRCFFSLKREIKMPIQQLVNPEN